ncbi:hypothetical protein GPJ56_005295 [Histomonas meleagridis]|uniref:uncharacterized protein n=1 Tax=Histomonas meleagridis TaxID=135588 RepID=UPI00355A27F0|nr:hypothetical protein GPJ56_005295 [Histomonas meleagridis]KAH0802144.1 hypothetical protein GO595_005225 [Histomonas meleagridis]
MEELDFIEAFTEPVVADDVLTNPLLTFDSYKDYVVERNMCQLCGWAKCPNPVVCKDWHDAPIFCSQECQFNSQQFKSSLCPQKTDDTIGPIIEKFSDQKPPKPLKSARSTEIDGYNVRVGPYRDHLNQIERWFGGFKVMPLKGLSEAQEKIFTMTNERLRPVGVTLKRTPDNLFFFGNINTKDPSILLEADDTLKDAFSYAILEVMTDTDMRPAINANKIPYSLYDDIRQIIIDSEKDEF